MSDTLKVGDTMVPDYKKNSSLVEPFVKALNGRVELFQMLLLKAEYVGSVLAKYGLAGMPTHEIKWGTESIFEYVRRKDFPALCGRMSSNYYYGKLELCRKLYEEDWGNAPKEEREKIKLFEVDVMGRTDCYDCSCSTRPSTACPSIKPPRTSSIAWSSLKCISAGNKAKPLSSKFCATASPQW